MTHPAALAARHLLRAHHSAALATLSKKFDGYPFASAVDYITDCEARPVFFISALAEHTRNIEHDSRASLLVQAATNGVQASPRLILVGDAHGVPESEAVALMPRYLRYFPDARQYFELDFRFYRFEPKQLRHIPGFAQARWLSPGDFRPPENRLAEQEEELIARISREHADALHALAGKAEAVVLAGLDCDGFDVRADGRILRFAFAQPVPDAAAAERALAALAGSAP